MIGRILIIAGIVLIASSCGHQKTSKKATPPVVNTTVANGEMHRAAQAKRVAMARAAVAEIKR